MALSACVSPPSMPTATANTPPQWQAPLPHNGQLTDLRQWWQQFNDPLLTQLIDAAQAESPTLGSAAARIAESRASRTAAGGALLPSLGANAGVSRAKQDPSQPIVNQRSAGLQADWEIDLFGGNRAARDAAQARLEGAQASWHAARVSVAAEVANTYVGLRACEAQLLQSQTDATSRAESSRLTELATRAGFQAPATAALARASSAQSNSLLTAQRAQCDLSVKALVALTAIDEPALRSQLAERAAQLPEPAQIALQSVPADVLNQRPDLYSAASDVIAASADVWQSRAARLPRITLGGSIASTRIESGPAVISGQTWSAGPVSITLPLFDAGARAANVDAARARYDESALLYRSKVRSAVREVEEALVQLHSTVARSGDARTAAEGYDLSFRSTESRFKGGLASLFELEEARRNAVLAQSTLIDLKRDRINAWIALYRALGGGWSNATPQAAAEATPNSRS